MSFRSHTHVPLTGAAAGLPPLVASRAVAEVSRVALRHLRTPADIERVLPLRGGIDLSAHQAHKRLFNQLEKKETNWASSARSSSTAS